MHCRLCSRFFTRAVLAVVIQLVVAVGAVVSVQAAPGALTLVSVSTSGEQGDQGSTEASISGNGRYVAFTSMASNLVPGSANGYFDAFLHDRETKTTSLISVSSAAEQANGNSGAAAISADGRFAAIWSDVTNLIAGDTNGATDIFISDLSTAVMERVSVSSTGEQANDRSFNGSLSADGRFVAFESSATNLVLGDTNGWRDSFVHDRVTDTTTRVSISSTGAQGNRSSNDASISSDGRFVAFESSAMNLVPDDTNFRQDVFVHDRATGTTERVSLSSERGEANHTSFAPAISVNGRFVAFASLASNLVAEDTNADADIFVRDRVRGTTTRVSLSTEGVQGNGRSDLPVISADGGRIVFQSTASNLVSDDTNGWNDVFVHDRVAGTTTRASVSSEGVEGNGWSQDPAISADGRFVAFASHLPHVPHDVNSWADVYVRELEPPASDNVAPTLPDLSDVTAEATSAAGATVNYPTPTATDNADPNPSVACTPASGSTFALGATTVSCIATDAAGNSSTRSFEVRVVDTTAPSLPVPPDVQANATSPSGAMVTYPTPTSMDAVDPTPSLGCTPTSGSIFPVGITTVTCTATDAAGNTSTALFQVTVKGAVDQIKDLIDKIKAMNAQQGISNSLDAKLEAVLAALDDAKDGRLARACKQLDAFMKEVSSQTGKELTVEQSTELLDDARRIKSALGCS